MLRVEVRNFQAIEHETIDVDGFSVVVGRSNIGKSALVRAIKAALTGAPVENFVRHSRDCVRASKGAKSCKCFCSVHFLAPDFDLLWEKGDSVNRYVFNGVEHTVVGKGTPEFLGPGFAPIYIGGDSAPTLLQVADQFRPLFILDRSGTTVADVLSDVARLDQINAAVQAADRDRRECTAARKLRDKDLRELGQNLKCYEPLDQVVKQAREVDVLAERVLQLENVVAVTQRFVSALATLDCAIQALSPVEGLGIPTLQQVVDAAAKVTTVDRWDRALGVQQASIERLRDAAGIMVGEFGALSSAGSAYGSLESWVQRLGAIKAVYMEARKFEVVAIPEEAALLTLEATCLRFTRWAEKGDVARRSIADLERRLRDIEAEEASIGAEFKALEVCPTCRQPVTVKNGLEEGGVGCLELL